MSLSYTGRGSDAKVQKIKLPEERGEDQLYVLDQAQCKALITLCSVLAWRTRHYTLPEYADTQDKLDDFTAQTEMRLMMPFDPLAEICSRIINCIETDTDVQNSIRDFILNDPAITQKITDIASNQVLSLEKRTTNLLKPEQCNPDYIFHQASVLVQLIHDLTEDIFEAIEVGTNQLERADILVGAIPAAGLNDTAATAFRVADQIAEEIQEDYMGSYDEGMFDTLRCAVFCACKDDCNLSLEKTIDVYKTLLEGEIPTDPIQAFVYVLQYIVTGDIPTDANVYIMHLLVLTAIQVGTNLLGIDFSRLANRILAAGDDADNDWEILCEDCPPIVYDRTPVINSNWDPTHEAGTISGPDEDGFWIITSGTRAFDEAITIMDISERSFVLSEVTYSEPLACQVWLLNDDLLHIACGVGDQYDGTTIDEFTVTWSSGGHRTMTFKMIAPTP